VGDTLRATATDCEMTSVAYRTSAPIRHIVTWHVYLYGGPHPPRFRFAYNHKKPVLFRTTCLPTCEVYSFCTWHVMRSWQPLRFFCGLRSTDNARMILPEQIDKKRNIALRPTKFKPHWYEFKQCPLLHNFRCYHKQTALVNGRLTISHNSISMFDVPLHFHYKPTMNRTKFTILNNTTISITIYFPITKAC